MKRALLFSALIIPMTQIHGDFKESMMGNAPAFIAGGVVTGILYYTFNQYNNSSLDKRLAVKEELLVQMREDIEKYEHRIAQLSTKIDEMQQSNNALQVELEAQTSNHQQRIEALEKEGLAQQDMVATLKQEKADLEKQMKEIDKKYKDEEVKLKKQLLAMKKEDSTKKARLTQLEKQVAKLEQQKADIEKSYASASKELEKVRTQLS